MKELTIEEKAKRYDEAIKLINTKWYYRNQPCFINVSELFPEFKENKDENIKKWLIEYFQEYKSTGIEGFANGLKIDTIIDWLEKQCDNNVTTTSESHITQYCCILDHNTGKVFKHCITEDEVNLSTEELLKKYGLNEDECSIMYASNNLELELLED